MSSASRSDAVTDMERPPLLTLVMLAILVAIFAGESAMRHRKTG